MDLNDTPEQAEFRARAREWIAAHAAESPPPATHFHAADPAPYREWQAKLAKAGLVGVTWPAEFGGAGLGPAEQMIANTELAAAGCATIVDHIAIGELGPTIIVGDEPTTALDVTIQAQIVDLVIRMRERLNMSMIWITHDLGVVAGMADRVIVMYAGKIVEEADVDNLYDKPQHPYTHALLAALPRADRRRDSRLLSIPGVPPNLLVPLHGCPFAPRCQYALEKCWTEMPPLGALSPTHRVACWVDPTTGEAR